MSNEPKPKPRASLLRHPFIIVLAGIIIAYAGYRFGVRLHAILH